MTRFGYVAIGALLVACATKEPEPLRSTSEPIGKTASAARHLLLRVSYRDGAFVLRSSREVDGPLRPLRGGARRSRAVDYQVVTDQGRVLESGSLPDPRAVRAELVDPATGELSHAGYLPQTEAEFVIRVSKPAEPASVVFSETSAPASAQARSVRKLGELALPEP
jgi:hypothetical protein